MSLRKLFVALFLLAFAFCPLALAQSVRPPDNAVNQSAGERAGVSNTLGSNSQSDYWRNLRGGVRGTVSIPDKNAGVMVQSEGWHWMLVRNGPLKKYGGYALGGVVALLVIFFLLRGSIKVESGLSGVKVLRFGAIARFGHWLNAIAFVALALTGLSLLYGKSVLLPIMGPHAFAALSSGAKFIHNWGAYLFIIGIIWIFLAFVKKNLPAKEDIIWIAKAGGLLTKGVHPPARFFNFGERVVFWSVVLCGTGVIITGLALLFPFQLDFIPGELPVHKMQFASLWHAILALYLIVVVIGHIYIGTVGIEGSLDGMKTGYVDRNWAREHHSLWLEQLESHSNQKKAAGELAE